MDQCTTQGMVRVLGGITATVDSSNEVNLSGARTQELLAALALDAGNPVRRDRLIDRIWPDSNETNARKALNTELWRLRKAIKHAGGDPDIWLDSASNSVTLRADQGVSVDLQQFRIHLDQAGGDPALLMATSELYTGEFAESLMSDWAIEERTVIRRTYLRLLQTLIDILRDDNQLIDALLLAERLIHEEPFDEEAHRSLIQVHIERGDHSAAVRHYQEFERLLNDELGVTPSPETKRLYQICTEGDYIAELHNGLVDTVNNTTERVYTIEKPQARGDSLTQLCKTRQRLRGLKKITEHLLQEIHRLESDLNYLDS